MKRLYSQNIDREDPPVSIITGAAGMLGAALIPTLKKAGHKVFPTDINTELEIDYLDIRDFNAVSKYMNIIRPNLVFHLAAETDLEICEANPDHAYLTNAIGTQNVCLAARKINAVIVYISTAGVFDGAKKTPYTEFDTPAPLNVYGKSKLEGEKFVEKIMDKYFIVRAGWMIGGGSKDKKFVAKIVKQLHDGAKILHVVDDKIGTPTYNIDFSRILAHLCKHECYGLYHAACNGSGTRLDVAAEILNWMEIKDVKLVPVSSEFFKDSYPTPRAPSEMMRNYMLELHGWNSLRDWRSALREYLADNWEKIGEAVQ